jgi:hypothetical protein
MNKCCILLALIIGGQLFAADEPQKNEKPKFLKLEMSVANRDGDFVHVIYNPVRNSSGHSTFAATGHQIKGQRIDLGCIEGFSAENPVRMWGMIPIQRGVLLCMTQKLECQVDWILLHRMLHESDTSQIVRYPLNGKVKEIKVAEDHGHQKFIVKLLMWIDKMYYKAYMHVPFADFSCNCSVNEFLSKPECFPQFETVKVYKAQ